MAALRTFRRPDSLALGVGICASLVAAALLIKSPLIAVAAVALLILCTTLGIEALIALSFLGATGLLPFVTPDDAVAGEIKIYAFFFLIAFGTMIGAYLVRDIGGKRSWPLPVNLVSIAVVFLLSYVLIVGLSSNPKEVPALAVPFMIFPLSAVGVILWSSHEDAFEGIKRVLPLVVVIVVVWALAYNAGAAGCGPCRSWVSTGVTNDGLLGPGSRLYTAGQNTFLGLYLAAFAYMLARPRPLSFSLVALGAVTIALQGSRAQYIAVIAGMALLLIWKFSQLKVGGRLALIAISGLALLALLNSPVGQKAISAYTETSKGTGTGTERLALIERTSEAWNTFGQGFSAKTLEIGFSVDLGLPNTLLVLGYVGAALQLLLIGLAIWRGVSARTLVGMTIAAIMLMVLVCRASLPLVEYGHAAVMYGAVVGLAAVLPVVHRKQAARAAAAQPAPTA